MIKEVIAVGKTIIEAKENARLALGADELAEVQYEIQDAGTKGFLGFLSRPAKVRAFIELPDSGEKRQRGDKKRNDKKNSNNKKNNNNPQKKQEERAPKAKAEEKPRTEVIPEESLKMERRFVEDGEDMSYDFVKTLLADIGLSAEAELYACEDGTRRITIVGDDASTLIGHHGDTLDALQYLANLASARKNSKGERDKSRVTLDIEGYRKKREETLRALARRMAQKALRNKRSVMLEPMSAYERRIIHSEIQGIEGVSTNSIGSDNNRKIVIFLTDKKPKELFGEEEEVVVAEPTAEAVVEAVEESSEE
jgi:spoIIIJ-associated protein